MKKQKKVKTKKEEFKEKYKVSGFVGKGLAWFYLMTMPPVELLSEIHKPLWDADKYIRKDKQLKKDLLNIDKLFFQILALHYHYPILGKDELLLVEYNVHTAVTLLTETINRFPIDGANHTDRTFEAYKKMLQLEKKLNNIKTSIANLPEEIDLALKKMFQYLENQFIAVDRVFSFVFLKYNEYAAFIEERRSEEDSKFNQLYDFITNFLENMKNLRAEYCQDHNFEHLLIGAGKEDSVTDVFNTPEKLPAKNKNLIDLTSMPDVTPKKTTEDIKGSAEFIRQVLYEHKTISVSPVLLRKSILEDLGDDEITVPTSIHSSFLEQLNDDFSKTIDGFQQGDTISHELSEEEEKEDSCDDKSTDSSPTNTSSPSSEISDDAPVSRFFVKRSDRRSISSSTSTTSSSAEKNDDSPTKSKMSSRKLLFTS